MTPISLIYLLILYPLVLAGDGCVLIAIALVATSGGNPWICGAAFATFHALYSILGTLVASHIASYSEAIGALIVFVGTLILLKHYVHHRLHHGSSGDCSCENHHTKPISTLQIISTAAALSIHSLAAGPIMTQISGVQDRSDLIAILLCSSILLGLLIAIVISVGESRRATIMRVLDSLPSAVTAGLTALACYSLFHLVEHAFNVPLAAVAAFSLISLILSAGAGYLMHKRVGARAMQSEPIVQLSSRNSKR